MQYRPRYSIYVPANRLRFPMAWTPMELHESRDGKLVSGQQSTKILGWREGRKYIKARHVGAYGTWRLICALYRKRNH